MSTTPPIIFQAIEPRPAPVRTTGLVAWVRGNLFGDALTSLATVLLGGLLLWYVPQIFEWAVLRAQWHATSQERLKPWVAALLALPMLWLLLRPAVTLLNQRDGPVLVWRSRWRGEWRAVSAGEDMSVIIPPEPQPARRAQALICRCPYARQKRRFFRLRF